MEFESARSDGEAAIDQGLFREVLASFPAGVVIVTANGDNGALAGVTVSAFCSVSAEPMLILVCIDRNSRTLHAIHSAGAFTVNILAADSEHLAMQFASKREDKFSGVAWVEPEGGRGGPILRSAAAYMVCTVDQALEAGDHWVFIGLAAEAGIRKGHPHLLYHRRAFHSVG